MLTDKQLKALKPKGHTYRLRQTGDPDTKGFHVVVSKSGGKSFALEFTSPETGNRRSLTLGRYPAVALAEAREAARQHRRTIARGIDPVEQAAREQAAAEAKRDLGTVADLVQLYIDNLNLDGKRSAGEVKRIFNRDIEDALGDLRANQVKPSDIADLLAAIHQRGAATLANRVRAYLHAAFELGLHAEQMPRWRGKVKRFDLTHNPVSMTKRDASADRRGQRYLSADELKQVWRTAGIERMDPQMATAIKLILATGQRVEEVLHATIDEFDLQAGLWTIPAERRKGRNKQPEPHLVPLTPLHIELVKTAKRLAKLNADVDAENKKDGQQWLFPSRKGLGPRTSDALRQAVHRFCNSIGIAPFSPRDLRRTWKTLAGSIGISLEARNRIQGHALQDVGSQHYDRYDYLAEKRSAMQQWSVWLEETVRASGKPKIVPLRNGNA